MSAMRRILPTRKLRELALKYLRLDIRYARRHEYTRDGARPEFYEMNAKYTSRLPHFQSLLQQLEPVDGRIVECGVGSGRSFFAFLLITQLLTRPREIWGFDTFEGIPAPTKEDGVLNAYKSGWWNYSLEDVSNRLRHNGIDESFIRDNATFVKGDLKDTLPAYDGAPIALLHLDVDVYASYKCALTYLFPNVAKGGIVTFDEYAHDTWVGATLAIDEFFADRPERIVKSPLLDRYYVVKEDDSGRGGGGHRTLRRNKWRFQPAPN